MLQGINRIGKSWVGKVVGAILFGILIVSFAIWGIGDIFRGAVRTQVASVGGTDISADAYRSAYQQEVQRLGRQTRQSISPERARLLGIDAQVLSRLINETALDQKARRLGLSISNQLVAKTITEDPSFQGAGGRFDRQRFEEVLYSNSLNEATYVRERRAFIARLQLAEAVTGAVPIPLAMREAVHRYGTERRAAAYVIMPASLAGEIAPPREEELRAFFEDRKAAFRTPEYRAVNILAVRPEDIIKPDEVSDADARKLYDTIKTSRFGSPEKRTVEQIGFPSLKDAETAFDRVRDGASFEALAAEQNMDPKTLELGTFAKSELFDPAVAQAAFALAEGAVSGPVQSRFGIVLLRVTKIEPERLRPFEEVAAEVKREAALERARRDIAEVHDAIEDLRASAKPLAEVARERQLALVSVPAVDRSGNDKAGHPVQVLPEREALLAAMFNSDIGTDNEALRTRDGGYVWFDVTGIEPARDKGLDEVRDAVSAQWRSDQVARRLADKARGLVERIEKGETLEAIAAELGLQAKSATGLARRREKDDLSAEVVGRIFAVPVGKAASAAGDDEKRTLFKVTEATVAPFVTSTSEAARVEEQLQAMLTDDLLSQYIANLQKELGVSIYQDNLRRAIGAEG